jgi:hypothetical protein
VAKSSGTHAAADEALAAALLESGWYVRFAAATRGVFPDSARHLLACVGDCRTAAPDSYPGVQRQLNEEMLALIEEIESGRIYGSKERCAVCGKPGAVEDRWIQPNDVFLPYFSHTACQPVSVSLRLGFEEPDDVGRRTSKLTAAAAIIRARRLRSEHERRLTGGAKDTQLHAGDRLVDRSGNGNDLTTKPGNPLPCAGCGKPSTRHLNHLRVCAECGNLLLATRGGGKTEVLAKLAIEHADAMAAELRDPHRRHGLVEMALDVYNGMAFKAGIPENVSGKTADEMVVADVRANKACRRYAAMLRGEADAESRTKAGGLRTDASCRAVRERMILDQVPGWIDPRRR